MLEFSCFTMASKMVHVQTQFHGSCLCCGVKYEGRSEIQAVSHCYCGMCQKAHGAAFGSYGRVPVNDFAVVQGHDLVRSYSSSPGVTRTFCASCGSPLTWHNAQGEFSAWVAVTLGTLDTPFAPAKHRLLHVESAALWNTCRDGLPRGED
jgi:hypothetical protein